MLFETHDISTNEKDILKDFFNNTSVQELLEDNNFDDLYNKYTTYINYPYELRYLTLLLDEANINPLSYLTWIPRSCFNSVKFINKDLVLPTNINTISEFAFSGSNLNSINIPNSVNYIAQFAFMDSGIKKIIFNDEENNIFRKFRCYSEEDFRTVYHLDDDVVIVFNK